MSLIDLMAAVRTSVSPAADRDAALRHAAHLLACRQAGADELHASLAERERLCSTAIGHGIAIPHGRCAALDAPRGALIRLCTPLDFGGGEPVDLVFALAVPSHDTQCHLTLLSELAQHFLDSDFRQALRTAPDADALLRIIATHTAPQAA